LAPSQQQLKPSDPVPSARITPSGDWRMGGSNVSAARWTISMVDRCEIRFALAFDVTRDRTGGAKTITDNAHSLGKFVQRLVGHTERNLTTQTFHL